MQITLIFDIGKTNKKYFLFDENLNILEQNQTVFSEIKDEDGFPCDDIELLSDWMIKKYHSLINKGLKINFINFSTYGASFVHLNSNLEVVTPLYNYLKPVESNFYEVFYKKYEGKSTFSKKCSSPPLDFLNSGLQIYWLKQNHNRKFQDIKHSLHLPNYCGHLFHSQLVSEYTSIGCHTAMWNFNKMDYHHWIKQESIINKLPKLVVGTTNYPCKFNNKIMVGTGIHDSSASLIPYLFGFDHPFILVSTGTWSISLNPFSQDELTSEELNQDCLEFLTVQGKKVRASRLFLGKEFEEQVRILEKIFTTQNDFKKVKFNANLYKNLKILDKKYFTFNHLDKKQIRKNSISDFLDFETAYHQLMLELMEIQKNSIVLAIGNSKDISTLFIDGGFSKNDLFCKIINLDFPNYQIKTTSIAAGSSIGAAIATNPSFFNKKTIQTVLNIKNI